MRHYGKFFKVLVKSPITLLSLSPLFRRRSTSAARVAGPAEYLARLRILTRPDQDVVVSGSVAIASVPAHGVASYRQSLLQPRPERIYSPITNAIHIVLSFVQKLRNALLGPNMEEIGSRFAVFPFEGMAGHQADYIAWLLNAAGQRMPNPPRSSSPRRSICSPPGCARRCRSSNI